MRNPTWYVVQELLNREAMRELRIMGRALDSAAETLAATESENAQRDLEKVRKLQRMDDRAEQLVGLLTGPSIDRPVSLLKQGSMMDTD